MKKKNNNQNEFKRLGGQKSGGGGYIPLSPPRSATGVPRLLGNAKFTRKAFSVNS